MDCILHISNLCKKYMSGKGIENINVELKKGMILGIVGLNGAGKTTLLSCITGCTNYDSGTIAYSFNDYREQKLRPEFLNEMGIVMREQGFPNHFNAIIINKIMKKVYKNWDEKMFFSILEEFLIDRKIKVKSFSTGMKSVLSFAVAISHHPQLLILDEIMDGLDVLARRKFRKYLFDFVEDTSKSVLFTTHEICELEKIADRLLLIDCGEIFLDLSKDDFLYRYKIFKMSNKQYSMIDKSDILYAKEEEYFVSILPFEAHMFKEKYKVDPMGNSLDKIFEILLEGKKNERISFK